MNRCGAEPHFHAVALTVAKAHFSRKNVLREKNKFNNNSFSFFPN